MKVLLVIPYLRNPSAGTVTYLRNLIVSLPNVSFSLLYNERNDDLIFSYPNVTLVPCKEHVTIGKFGITLDFLKMYRAVREANVVHSHGLWLWLDVLIGPLTLIGRRSHIISVHGFLTKWSRRRHLLFKALILFSGQLFTILNAKLILVTNESESGELPWYARLTDNRIIDNFPSLPQCITDVTRSDYQFGFISRIHPKKNLLTLLKVFTKNKSLKSLVIAGPVEDRKYFSLCEEYIKNDDRIKYVGEVKGTQKSDFYTSVQCVVLPTRSENYGYVVTEALSFGCNVLVSKETPWSKIGLKGLFTYSNDNHMGEALKLLSVIDLNRDITINDYLNYYQASETKHKLLDIYHRYGK